MNHALPRTLIETIVRRTIQDLQDDPKRSTRNLVDMALNFSEGRFQNHFFQVAQTMLKNENSAYYKMIPDAAAAMDTDKVVMFGLNLGYNSCTAGAKKIREYEKKEHFNIPWSVALAISGREYQEKESEYRRILREGKNLGIYTWMIWALDGVDKILPLAVEHPECAFVIYCEPEEICDTMLDEAEDILNIMFAVHHTDCVEEACSLLRSRHFLYSVYHVYEDSDLNEICSGEMISDTETLHPAFTGFLAGKDCSEQTKQSVYRYVSDMRVENQKCPTILWDCVNDSRFIDSVISEDACLAGFDREGSLFTFHDSPRRQDYNIFKHSLQDIFRLAFPKKCVPV